MSEDPQVDRMRNTSIRQIWIHALGAKVGGGLTYLHAIVPHLVEQLEGKGIRVVLLLPYAWQGLPLPDWFEVRAVANASKGRLRRLVFDNITLPRLLRKEPNSVLFCSGSFSPLWKPVPTTALLRNTIYFDDEFQKRARFSQRINLMLQRFIIARGAKGCTAVFYPSATMRQFVESHYPGLKPQGIVSYYGIGDAFRTGLQSQPVIAGNKKTWTLLYVMTYTLQKNMGYLLKALAIAKNEGLSIRVVVTSDLKNGPEETAATDQEIIRRHDLIGSGYLVCAGTRHGKALLDLYSEADACLFPSLTESFGHPLVEAMALGKPLICADLPYAHEICGAHAAYVNSQEPEQLVALWRVWPKPMAEITKADRAQLLERFSWSGHVAQLLKSLLATG